MPHINDILNTKQDDLYDVLESIRRIVVAKRDMKSEELKQLGEKINAWSKYVGFDDECQNMQSLWYQVLLHKGASERVGYLYNFLKIRIEEIRLSYYRDFKKHDPRSVEIAFRDFTARLQDKINLLEPEIKDPVYITQEYESKEISDSLTTLLDEMGSMPQIRKSMSAFPELTQDISTHRTILATKITVENCRKLVRILSDLRRALEDAIKQNEKQFRPSDYIKRNLFAESASKKAPETKDKKAADGPKAFGDEAMATLLQAAEVGEFVQQFEIENQRLLFDLARRA